VCRETINNCAKCDGKGGWEEVTTDDSKTVYVWRVCPACLGRPQTGWILDLTDRAFPGIDNQALSGI
jgi:hypothetical protein